MFIILPLIIIFLLFAYLQLSENVTLFAQIVVYTLMILTIYLSYFIYKKIKTDLKLQEINQILLEIDALNKKMNKTTDIKLQEAYLAQIEILNVEYKEKVSNL